jgi:hypothetical protein
MGDRFRPPSRPAEAPLSGDLTVVMPVRGRDPAAALVAPAPSMCREVRS